MSIIATHFQLWHGDNIFYVCWELLGSSTLGTMGHRLKPKILDTTDSLQLQMAGEPYTPYWIWPHHSKLKTRGHQPKKNLSQEQSTPSLFPPSDGHGQVGFHHLSTRLASLLDLGQDPSLQSNVPMGFQQRISTARPEASWSDGHRRLARWDVASGTHMHLIACTRVLNKHALLKKTYFMLDSVAQVPIWSTLNRISMPQASHPPERLHRPLQRRDKIAPDKKLYPLIWRL
jgi:hypothetical protein